MEQHDAGLSGAEIGRLFRMSKNTVNDFLKKLSTENPDLGNPVAQAPSVLPLANTVEDRVLMINKLVQMDEKRFMKNAFMVDINEVMAALQITKMQARLAVDPKNEELKTRRDAAIMNQHKKGLSAREIARLFGFNCHKVVSRVIEEALGQNPDSGKRPTQESFPSVLPLANTEDRSDTRVDADEFVDDFLSEYDDYISLSEDETDSEPAPTFDLKAATGFTPSARKRKTQRLGTRWKLRPLL